MSLASFITLTAVPRIAQARRGFGREKPCKFSKAFGPGMAGGRASIKPRAFPEDFLYATCSRSKPFRENELDEARNPVGIKSLMADFVLSGRPPSQCVLQESSLSTFDHRLLTSARSTGHARLSHSVALEPLHCHTVSSTPLFSSYASIRTIR